MKGSNRTFKPGIMRACIYMLFVLFTVNTAFAATAKGGDDITFTITPTAKDALFKGGRVVYNVDIVNGLTTTEDGKISYRVTTEKGKFLDEDSVKISLGSKGIKHLEVSMPAQQTGFYKLLMMINVADYDDTIRRAFGVNAEKIRSEHAKPSDFDAFWNDTKQELASVKPEFKLTYLPDSSKVDHKAYLFEMKSLDNLTIRGYMTIPIAKNPKKKFVVLLQVPPYQVPLTPMFASDMDIAIVSINVRGQGNSRDVIHTRHDDYIFYNVEDKNKYVMRGAIMDCIRTVDFIFTQPQLDHNRIIVVGGSMGGFLAIATASLDHRISICSAQNPILSDIRNLEGEAEWPLNVIKRHVATLPGVTMDKVMDNLDYFDTKNFATNVDCSTLIGIGLLDNLVPPNNAYVVYNNLHSDKHIMAFAELAHEVGMPYKIYESRWMHDYFGLF